ncbi:MAG: ATP-binding protein [Mesorhizobium sp.]|uniref:AlbA family DNA-binding domain-containing protein n=1 Tax=unclassified Mesorhizobium TaxID=325217 RepID=UPI000F74C521|nr:MULTISPECIES: ATP-binding protein [unclassified Mesorhizobium]RVC81959.1 ATP-binding protein [Mesorhizobium sp. M2A.F.Ca.ET.046.02.1.1]AZO34220.1 ATP-binding protein [Mesorhizobium sp. M2A.F.Ca.ET.046.03.2.1]AZO71652.1 ATP-binding protein [Mesorhizobium sp. M1D.F.Ca.ET.043.01.1.1]RWB49770.1 MAG: ATP-binding protein [Mesorhizobium sp.]RWE22466.1 MAG: ATP-binding protein [Mesorhizobium sp.]
MSILQKSLDEVVVSDLEQICAHQVRETYDLEFKKDLPFLRVKGQTEEADRWVTRGDRVGDYARDKILAELIAFANAERGTLILGIDETDDEPRRARAISPVPRCEDLAKRLADSCEDVIEPRLPLVAARALPLDGDAGVVILRVGRSSIGPHRLASDGQFYTRRGERSVRMTVREVRDLVLEINRRGNAIEELFSARRAVTRNDLQFAWRTATSKGISRCFDIRPVINPAKIKLLPSNLNRSDTP